MNLNRFAADGRYLGFIVQDRPLEAYAGRADLTTLALPPLPWGAAWPYFECAEWVLVEPAPAEPAGPEDESGAPAPATAATG